MQEDMHYFVYAVSGVYPSLVLSKSEKDLPKIGSISLEALGVTEEDPDNYQVKSEIKRVVSQLPSTLFQLFWTSLLDPLSNITVTFEE